MQSGINVSQELRAAFNELVSSSAHRGLIATIEAESVKPLQHIPSTSSDFFSDLLSLKTLLSSTQAAYILLRRYNDASDGYVAITFVPDGAPVRQKMLFASTRLTLERELGKERFRETLFATELQELGRDGWERHDSSKASQAPLTTEEETLKGVKEAEAEAKGGTEGRRLETGGKLSMAISEEARRAIGELGQPHDGKLVQVRVDTKHESIEFVSSSTTEPDGLASTISDTEPRYSLFNYGHPSGGTEQLPLIFIYSCPSGLGVREKMLYASSKAGFLAVLQGEFGLTVAKKFEVTDPSEIDASTIATEFAPAQEQKQGFSRPKRPGRR